MSLPCNQLQEVHPRLLQIRTGEEHVAGVCSLLPTNGAAHPNGSLQWFFSVAACWPLLFPQVSLSHPTQDTFSNLGRKEMFHLIQPLDALPLNPIVYDLKGRVRVIKYKCAAVMAQLRPDECMGERGAESNLINIYSISITATVLPMELKILDLCVPQFPQLWNGGSNFFVRIINSYDMLRMQ